MPYKTHDGMKYNSIPSAPSLSNNPIQSIVWDWISLYFLRLYVRCIGIVQLGYNYLNKRKTISHFKGRVRGVAHFCIII